MKIIVTGFQPFGNAVVNPSMQALEMLQNRIAGADIIRLTLPVAYGRAAAILESAVAAEMPEAVLSLGLAAGRSGITVERTAVNVNDAASPDNDGITLTDAPIIAGAPAAYFTTLPRAGIVAAIRGESLPASTSDSAGTYVCNDLMYRMLHYTASYKLPVKSGFIHVPLTPEMTPDGKFPSMPLENIAKAIRIALEVIAAGD